MRKTDICLGIHVHSEPERLRATIHTIRANSTSPIVVVLLPDGADMATRQVLKGLCDIPQLATAEPRGAAACFNRLVKSVSADIYVLLESGALVGPGWLENLLAALNADPRNGWWGPRLIAPGTNNVFFRMQVANQR